MPAAIQALDLVIPQREFALCYFNGRGVNAAHDARYQLTLPTPANTDSVGEFLWSGSAGYPNLVALPLVIALIETCHLEPH